MIIEDNETAHRLLDAISSSKESDLPHLTKVAGLDPTTDFIRSDLSGADLRFQDLTEFDLTGASLTNAYTFGTRFNNTASPDQLAASITYSKNLVLLGGKSLASKFTQLSDTLPKDTSLWKSFSLTMEAGRESLRRSQKSSMSQITSSDQVQNSSMVALGVDFNSYSNAILMFDISGSYDLAVLKETLSALIAVKREQVFIVIFCDEFHNTKGLLKSEISSIVKSVNGDAIIIANGISSISHRYTGANLLPVGLEALDAIQFARYISSKSSSVTLANIPGVKADRTMRNDDLPVGLFAIKNPRYNSIGDTIDIINYSIQQRVNVATEILIPNKLYNKKLLEVVARRTPAHSLSVSVFDDTAEDTDIIFYAIGHVRSLFWKL